MSCFWPSPCYSPDVSSFEERRRLRANWPVRKFLLGEEPLTDDRDTTTVDERIALVAELTRTQWNLAGLPEPRYERHEIPGKIVRPR